MAAEQTFVFLHLEAWDVDMFIQGCDRTTWDSLRQRATCTKTAIEYLRCWSKPHDVFLDLILFFSIDESPCDAISEWFQATG
jgi:hypothetical protein